MQIFGKGAYEFAAFPIAKSRGKGFQPHKFTRDDRDGTSSLLFLDHQMRNPFDGEEFAATASQLDGLDRHTFVITCDQVSSRRRRRREECEEKVRGSMGCVLCEVYVWYRVQRIFGNLKGFRKMSERYVRLKATLILISRLNV